MSLREEIAVKCPNCNKESLYHVWGVIDTATDPDMKERVRNKELFSFTCSHCGVQSVVLYAFLYHQVEDKIMIYHVEREEDIPQGCEQFIGENLPKDTKKAIKNYLSEGYRIRVVSSHNELLEKLFIFEAGLDDRIVELAKWLFLNQIADLVKDKNIQEVRFYLNEDREKCLDIIYEDETSISPIMEEDFYEAVVNTFKDNFDDDLESNLVINFPWAMQILEPFFD